VLALKGSFHGHTSGARSLLANPEKRNIFSNMLGLTPVFIDDQSPDCYKHLQSELVNNRIKIYEVVKKNNKYVKQEFYQSIIICSIAEPIIGEGGIRITNRKFLSHLSNLNIPLIIDEIQSGLGRSGSFLASEGINAHYYIFGKSLGGGIEKISAVLIDRKIYRDDFGKYYTSTFSNGGLACHVANKTLAIINDEKIPEKAKHTGEILKSELIRIQNKYPRVIEEITGEGLMQGIKFCDLSNRPDLFLRNLYNLEYCGLLFSSYLLNNHNIRILPTLSSPNILRIEPSVYLTKKEITRLAFALDDLAGKIQKGDFYSLFLHLMEGDPFEDNKGKIPEIGFMDTSLAIPKKNAIKVGLLAHFTYPVEELRMLEKDFCKASDTALRILFNRMQVLLEMKPMVILQRNLFGGRIHFSFLAIPVDPAELERLHKQNKKKDVVFKIQQAVNTASKMGIEVLSLGAYTSILSNNGLALAEPGKLKIVTGNTLTAISGIRRLINKIKSKISLDDNRLAIIGASGNIGSIITESLLNSEINFEKIWLIGRNKSKLQNGINRIIQNNEEKHPDIGLSTDLRVLKECNVIIVATNTNDPIVFPHHLLAKREVIITDLSIPSAISKEVLQMPNIVNIPFASYIYLPEDIDFLISSHTPRGAVFCCAAEGILCGLEPNNVSLKGKISRQGINTVSKAAEKHGFFNFLGSEKNKK